MKAGQHNGNCAFVVQPEKVDPDTTKKPQRNRIIVGAVVGLITLLVITASVVLAVYFGMKMTRDTYKEAWKTYQTKDGETIVQKTEVKADEVDVTVANELKVIYDYKNKLQVMRMKDQQTGQYGDCYAKRMHESEADYIPEEQATSQTDTVDEEYTIQYSVTSNPVPENIISRSVSELCQGGNIFWMERIVTEARIKRRICYCYRVKIGWFRRRICVCF